MARVDKVDTIKGNKIIAEFMGFNFSKTGSTARVGKGVKSSPYRLSDLHYHDSWSLLMPVVLLLEDKGVDVKIYYKNTQIEWSDEDCSYEVKSGIQGETKIDATWTAIVYFLSWVKDSDVDLDNPVWYE